MTHTMNIIYFLWLLFVVKVTTSQQEVEPISYCNETVNSMKKMLDMASQSFQSIGPNYGLCVELSDKEENLEYSNMTVPFSVFIRPGAGFDRCTLTCERDFDLPLSNYEWFPLIIKGSDFVVIENIDFVGCIRPVQLMWIKNVQLLNTTFSDFTEGGALEVSNSPLVLVDSCQFTNNTSEGIGKTRYSGNSGGLSIGFDDVPRPPDFKLTTPKINITGTVFTRNTANASGEFLHDVSFVLKNNIYNQRGGGLAIYIGTSNYSADIRIHNCTVQKNVARDSGGGVYMNIQGENNSHQVLITDTLFLENNGPDGGGLEITQYSGIRPDKPHHAVNIYNCQFEGNMGNFGGGYKSIQVFVYLNTVNLYNCTFINNSAPVGAAMYLQSIYTIPVATVEEKSIVQDCTFENNNGNRGTLFVIQNSVGIRGTTVFRNNTGPALRILHCLVSLGGDIWFIGNRAHPEGFSGALYFSQYGQVLLKEGVNIRFINNTGNEGACIVVKDQLISGGFPQQLYNPQCFLQYEEPTLPTQWWNVSMLFEGNKALLGPVVYTSDLDPCQWYNEKQPYFSLNSSTIWAFMEMRDNSITRGDAEYVSPEDYVQTDIHFVEIPDTTTVTAPPGTLVTLDVIALDQLGRNTSAFLELLNGPDFDGNDVEFEPTIAQTVAGTGQISFKYASSNLTGITDMILRASFLSTENIPNTTLKLVHELCLPGYAFTGQKCRCIEGTSTVLLCLPDQKGILLTDGLWGAPPTWSRTLVTHTCPSGYCNCTGDMESQETEGCPLLYDSPDMICNDNREGLLCGQCKDGMGVGLLTNFCRAYVDKIPQAIWLLPIYLALLVVGLVLIVRLGLHLPTIFRGFLFYIQISSAAVAYLPVTFRLNTDVMDCIWSATSLYIPYDFSFHEGLTSLESYGLRYLTPLIALIVAPIAVRAGGSHSKRWHGTWTVILLVYTRAVDTSISLLHCPTLTGTLASGELDIITLWFFDGDVRCFQGAHIFLGIVSILALLFLIVLIPVTALIIYHHKIKRTYPSPERVEKLTVAITKGFKEKYKWWPVMELACRFLFIAIVTLTPGFTFVPLILSLILLGLQMAVYPYESKWANAAETFALLWLVILLALGNTTPIIIASKDLDNFTLWPLFFLPVAIGGCVFIAYIAYKIWLWCKSRRTVKKHLNRDIAQSRRQRFGASFSLRRHNFVSGNVTRTVVSFDNIEDDYEMIETNMIPTNSPSVIN